MTRPALRRFGLLLLPLLALASTEVAAGSFFAGAGWGESRFEVDEVTGSFRVDDDGYTLFAGYRFLKFTGIEVGFADLGEFRTTVNGVSIDGSAEVYKAFALGILPMGPRLDLYAKAGIVSWETEGTVSPGPVSGSGSDDGTDLGYGAGLAYRLNKVVGLRLEFEQYEFDDVDEVRFSSLGIHFKF